MTPTERLTCIYELANNADWQANAKYPEQFAVFCNAILTAIDIDNLEPVERLQMENNALREMLEAAEDRIHGEWGCGPREDYDWLPEMEQHICGQKTGHQPTKTVEKRWETERRKYRRTDTMCALCDANVGPYRSPTQVFS